MYFVNEIIKISGKNTHDENGCYPFQEKLFIRIEVNVMMLEISQFVAILVNTLTLMSCLNLLKANKG